MWGFFKLKARLGRQVIVSVPPYLPQDIFEIVFAVTMNKISVMLTIITWAYRFCFESPPKGSIAKATLSLLRIPARIKVSNQCGICHRAFSSIDLQEEKNNNSFPAMLLMVAAFCVFLLLERTLHPFFSVFYWLMIWIVLASLGVCLAPVLSASRVSKSKRAHTVEFTHKMQWTNLENC